jgi:nucleotide-binding universal stress UspA family protein
MYKRILLPLDGSAIAEQALPHAIDLACRFQAELILIRVLVQSLERPSLYIKHIEQAEKEIQILAQEYLYGIAAQIKADNLIKVQAVTVQGVPHEEIVRFAEENSIGLIVICSRGQSGISRWLMGSVADRVTRCVKTPVLLIRAK